MRRLDSYIKKYGEVQGRIIYRTLQKEAAHAKAKAFWRRRARGIYRTTDLTTTRHRGCLASRA